MIPSQTFESYPLFASGAGATKVQPGDAKLAAGFQQADVLPAEWMNWAWNKNSKGITDHNAGLSSVEAELNNVLSENHITPAQNDNTQVFKAIRKIDGCITTAAGTPTTITNAPSIEAGNVVRVMFGAAVTGSDTTTGLLISYNGSSKPVKVNKNGSLVDFVAVALVESGSTVYRYLQANTTLELVYDGVNFVIAGNPVVLSSTDYTIYADGKIVLKTIDEVTSGAMEPVTSNAVANNIEDAVTDGVMKPVTSNAVADALSYFTTEQKTGGKWIDGKDIYRKCIPITLPNESGDWFNITGVNPPSNVDQHIKVWGFSNTTNGFTQIMPGSYGLEFSAYYHLYRSYTRSGGNGWLIIEYTKNE